MSFLASISLVSGRTLAVVAVLAILSLVAGASLLPRYAPSRFPRPKRHWFARTVIILVPTLLVASAGGLIANRSLGIVKTSGDLGKLIQSSVVGSEAQSGGEVTIGNQSIDPSALGASFTRTDDGMLVATWTGPTSGITLPVYVIAPRDYSPTDGKTYAVIELLHGYPGEADGTTQGAQVQQALDDAIDAGIIPPTIVVAPSLSVDEEAHDCADIEGRPPVYTWAAHEVPAMIRHNFPNTSANRDAWMIGGFSAGAYCAIWTALRTPETFGAAASLSGYDTQIEGQMTNQGDQYLADNTLSTMLANRTPDGMRIYAMAAGDDVVGGAYTALKMAAAVRPPDTVTTDVPPPADTRAPVARTHPDDARVVGILRPRRERGGRRPDRSDGPGLRGLRVHRSRDNRDPHGIVHGSQRPRHPRDPHAPVSHPRADRVALRSHLAGGRGRPRRGHRQHIPVLPPRFGAGLCRDSASLGRSDCLRRPTGRTHAGRLRLRLTHRGVRQHGRRFLHDVVLGRPDNRGQPALSAAPSGRAPQERGAT